ncbi:MAG: LEA type 2 family protein [Gemmatimonadota bacterium]|nr:LEA type 2 family protein [Gemmatimonadota bacterium]
MARVAAAVLMTTGAAGCAGLGQGSFLEPDVTVDTVNLRGLGLTGGSLDIRLAVYNPNRIALDATRLTYTLWVDSLQFGSGATEQRSVLESRDTTYVNLPLSFTWAGVGAAGRELMNTGSVNYRVAGDIRVGSALGDFTIPYDRNGRFSTLGGTSR